jgi:hypothetical protein
MAIATWRVLPLAAVSSVDVWGAESLAFTLAEIGASSANAMPIQVSALLSSSPMLRFVGVFRQSVVPYHIISSPPSAPSGCYRWLAAGKGQHQDILQGG